VHTTEGELCDCTNELTQTCIYTNLGAYLGPTSYFGSSNLLYYFYGPTSLPGNYISTLLYFLWVDFSSMVFYFTLFFFGVCLCHYYSSLHFNRKEHHKNKITEKYTFTRDTAFILGNPLGEENPAKTSLS